ncbi:MAG: response regulator [Myxococcota bacterium]|jgi:CheY-like chemotaxis protein
MAQPLGPLPDSVLLVDDEPSVIDVLSKALTRGGLTVKAVKTAEQAFPLLDSERFGAVVTDKNLPQRSGLDVVRAAREKQPYCACIVITGFVSAASVLEALQLGANDYILKPFDDLALVVQRIKRAIASQRTEAERATLAEMIKDLARSLHDKDDSLRAKEEEVFQTKTELDLFTSVMDLRIEEATRPLLTRLALLESDVQAEQERRGKLKRTLGELAARVREAAKSAGEGADALEQVAQALDAEAGALG